MKRAHKKLTVLRSGDYAEISGGYYETDCRTLSGGKREKVKEFSWKSKKALSRKLAKLDWKAMEFSWGKAKWVTLTLDGNKTGQEDAKKALHNLLSRSLPRTKNHSPVIWRAELQKRGAIHFHFIMWGRIDEEWLAETWHRLTGSNQDKHREFGVDVKTVEMQDHNHVQVYISKYVSKDEKGEGTGWNHGRVWGVYRRNGLINNKERVIESDESFEKFVETAKSEKISVPREIYQFGDYCDYVEEMIKTEKNMRIDYYLWRKERQVTLRRSQNASNLQKGH